MNEAGFAVGFRISAEVKTTHADSKIYCVTPDSDVIADPIIKLEEFCFEAKDGYPLRFFTEFEEFIYLTEGILHHADDLGNSKSIGEGDAIRIISGKGIHVSEFAGSKYITKGVRIWMNTCREDRNKLADFSVAKSDMMPITKNLNLSERTIAGEDSPLKVCGEVIIKDVEIKPHTSTFFDLSPEYINLIYVFSEADGMLLCDNEEVNPAEAYIFNNKNNVLIHSSDKCSRFIFISAKPVHEPLKINESVSAF